MEGPGISNLLLGRVKKVFCEGTLYRLDWSSRVTRTSPPSQKLDLLRMAVCHARKESFLKTAKEEDGVGGSPVGHLEMPWAWSGEEFPRAKTWTKRTSTNDPTENSSLERRKRLPGAISTGLATRISWRKSDTCNCRLEERN